MYYTNRISSGLKGYSISELKQAVTVCKLDLPLLAFLCDYNDA